MSVPMLIKFLSSSGRTRQYQLFRIPQRAEATLNTLSPRKCRTMNGIMSNENLYLPLSYPYFSGGTSVESVLCVIRLSGLKKKKKKNLFAVFSLELNFNNFSDGILVKTLLSGYQIKAPLD